MLRGDPTRDSLTRAGRLVTAGMIALVSWGLGLADALDGVLEVRSAYVNVDKGVFLLHARVEYPNGPAIRSALRDGQTLTFELDARVDRDRRFWFSAGIVDLTLGRQRVGQGGNSSGRSRLARSSTASGCALGGGAGVAVFGTWHPVNLVR